jgi:hypothetical protein
MFDSVPKNVEKDYLHIAQLLKTLNNDQIGYISQNFSVDQKAILETLSVSVESTIKSQIVLAGTKECENDTDKKVIDAITETIHFKVLEKFIVNYIGIENYINPLYMATDPLKVIKKLSVLSVVIPSLVDALDLID